MKRIIGGLIVGILLGLVVPQFTVISLLGDLFVGALKAVAPLLKISFPLIVEKAAFSAGKVIVNSMCSAYGSLTVGALGICNNITGIFSNAQSGYQEGCAAIISQNLGAGKPARALEAFKKIFVINLLFGSAGLIISCFPLIHSAIYMPAPPMAECGIQGYYP